MRQNSLFDDFSRLMSDASEIAVGVRREAETAFKSQVERLLSSMDIVTREEFEAIKQMAILAREENEKLLYRINALEQKMGGTETSPEGPAGDL